MYISNTFEGEIKSTVGQLNQNLLNWLVIIFRIDTVSGTEFTRY